MNELQNRLEERFLELSKGREGPVYFIEHGLASMEVDELFTQLGCALHQRSFGTTWWQTVRLPLIVASTEVGYRYRGTGTDFWPKFEAKVRCQLDTEFRNFLKNSFERYSQRFQGVTPPPTAWANNFSIIIWPITNAILPIEFHRSMGEALSNLRVNISQLSDREVHSAIQRAASCDTSRFLTLLHSEQTIVPLVRSLISEGSSFLSSAVIDRIRRDIERDREANELLKKARMVQRRAGKPNRSVSQQSCVSVAVAHLC